MKAAFLQSFLMNTDETISWGQLSYRSSDELDDASSRRTPVALSFSAGFTSFFAKSPNIFLLVRECGLLPTGLVRLLIGE